MFSQLLISSVGKKTGKNILSTKPLNQSLGISSVKDGYFSRHLHLMRNSFTESSYQMFLNELLKHPLYRPPFPLILKETLDIGLQNLDRFSSGHGLFETGRRLRKKAVKGSDPWIAATMPRVTDLILQGHITTGMFVGLKGEMVEYIGEFAEDKLNTVVQALCNENPGRDVVEVPDMVKIVKTVLKSQIRDPDIDSLVMRLLDTVENLYVFLDYKEVKWLLEGYEAVGKLDKSSMAIKEKILATLDKVFRRISIRPVMPQHCNPFDLAVILDILEKYSSEPVMKGFINRLNSHIIPEFTPEAISMTQAWEIIKTPSNRLSNTHLPTALMRSMEQAIGLNPFVGCGLGYFQSLEPVLQIVKLREHLLKSPFILPRDLLQILLEMSPSEDGNSGKDLAVQIRAFLQNKDNTQTFNLSSALRKAKLLL